MDRDLMDSTPVSWLSPVLPPAINAAPAGSTPLAIVRPTKAGAK
jgi:hypothetical protein